jgi:hypothetical protein
MIFMSLRSRSFLDGIDKLSFNHFCQLPVNITLKIYNFKGTMGFKIFEVVFEEKLEGICYI